MSFFESGTYRFDYHDTTFSAVIDDDTAEMVLTGGAFGEWEAADSELTVSVEGFDIQGTVSINGVPAIVSSPPGGEGGGTAAYAARVTPLSSIRNSRTRSGHTPAPGPRSPRSRAPPTRYAPRPGKDGVTMQDNTLRVFIENEAGSDIKHHYDEDTYKVLRTERVGAEYPYPYGFVPGTLAPDGDAADCFVITHRALRSGAVVDCEPIALLEQTEGGQTDHNVLAVIAGEPIPDLAEVRATISRFIEQFRAGVPGGEGVPGGLLEVEDAFAYVQTCAEAKTDHGDEIR